jgi:hypothetical protein
MEKQLIPVYADPELMHRIELAAAKHNVPVTEYCLDAIEQKLADEGLLEEKISKFPSSPQSKTIHSLMRCVHCMKVS